MRKNAKEFVDPLLIHYKEAGNYNAYFFTCHFLVFLIFDVILANVLKGEFL